MQQVVIYAVHFQRLHRVVIHLLGGFQGMCRRVEVGQFGGHEIFLPWIPAQGYACCFLGQPLTISRRCVEIIDPMLYRIIHHSVDCFLVDYVFPVMSLDEREPHHSEPEQRYLVSCLRVGAHGHFSADTAAVNRIAAATACTC